MAALKGNSLGSLLATELVMGIAQTAVSIVLYAIAAISTGRKVGGPRYVIVNICFSMLLFGQIIAAVAYDRGGQLDDRVGTRLLEEAGLWYVRLYLVVKPGFSVASTLVDLVILRIALRMKGYRCICTEIAEEMRSRMFGLHDGRFGRAEFLYGWQDVKQGAFLMIRAFGQKKLPPESPSNTHVYYRGDMCFELIDGEEVNGETEAVEMTSHV